MLAMVPTRLQVVGAGLGLRRITLQHDADRRSSRTACWNRGDGCRAVDADRP